MRTKYEHSVLLVVKGTWQVLANLLNLQVCDSEQAAIVYKL